MAVNVLQNDLFTVQGHCNLNIYMLFNPHVLL